MNIQPSLYSTIVKLLCDIIHFIILFKLESIIMWREISQDGHESDYAISFEHTSACRFIWDSIGEVQSQYLQQNEYGTNPSFAHLSSSNSIDDVNKADEYRISSTSEKSGRLRSNSYGETSLLCFEIYDSTVFLNLTVNV